MQMIITLLLSTIIAALAFIAINSPSNAKNKMHKGADIVVNKPDNFPIATLAGGCFWCIESEFRALDGVLHTRSGYIGGKTKDPTYEDITSGRTGHAEAIEITFAPNKISYRELISFFLIKAHDPTQLNRQGVDIGTQYRSEIFFHDEKQKKIATDLINETNSKKIYDGPIVTKISPATTFWVAEGYHQQYYEKYEKKNKQLHPRVQYKIQMKK